jgi:hypothetical protein
MSIPGPNVLLVGATGSGKTHAIRTLLETGIEEVFVIFTEPGMEVLNNTPEDKLHWHYIAPANADWETMIKSATKINTMSFEALSKLGDMHKNKYNQFIQVLETLHNFVDDRTGQEFGDITQLDRKCAVIVDSLSGLDWGVAMDNLERLIQKLCTDTTCTFVLTAHLEREVDEVLGGVKLMASTLGRKLAPRLPRFFSDVILCERKGKEFSWNTASLQVDLKARNLEIGDNLPPSFVPLMEQWLKNGGTYEETE